MMFAYLLTLFVFFRRWGVLDLLIRPRLVQVQLYACQCGGLLLRTWQFPTGYQLLQLQQSILVITKWCSEEGNEPTAKLVN